MKTIGIAKASRRLAAAEERLKRLRELSTGIDVPAFQDEWYHFLCDLQAVPEILATSSRSDPRSRQWFFGQKKKEIENDPLLDFLHHARGCDFHGVDIGSDLHTEPNKYLGYHPQFAEFAESDGETKKVGAIHLEGDARWFTISYKLAQIVDEKNKNTFPPPREHFGSAISDKSAVEAAELAFTYYGHLIEEAWKRAK